MSVFTGFPPDTPLVLYEEIKPDFVEKINNYSEPLEKVLFISFIPTNCSLDISFYYTNIFPNNYVGDSSIFYITSKYLYVYVTNKHNISPQTLYFYVKVYLNISL